MTSSIASLAYKIGRDKEREIEASRVGPGYIDPYKPFGSNVKGFTIGKKKDWKPDNNPPVGGYNTKRAFSKLLHTAGLRSSKRKRHHLDDQWREILSLGSMMGTLNLLGQPVSHLTLGVSTSSR